MKKKILSVLLAVVMLASACSMMIVPVSAATTLSTDNSGAYLISSAADVETFRTMMVNGETFAGKTVKLTDDIDMKNAGDYLFNDKQKGFLGTFDGQGYSISNLTVAGGSNNGFFGFAGTTSWKFSDKSNVVTIKNVAFINSSSVSNEAAANNVGLLYGSLWSATLNLENVYIDTTMNSRFEGEGNPSSTQGGLIGYAYAVHWNAENCVFDITTRKTTEGGSLKNSGAIIGITDWNGKAETEQCKITMNQSALYGSVIFYETEVYVGADSGNTFPVGNAMTNTLIDLWYTSDNVTSKTVTGVWGSTLTLDAETTAVTAMDIKGFDATAVEGFTATTGHMVPTTLLALFPQHFLTEANADEGAQVAFQGYQTTAKDENGKAKVRLVATLADDYKNYDEVGFEVVAVYEKDGVKTAKSQKVACTKVYSSISAVTGNEAYPASISASSLIGEEGYIFAMVITGVPEGISIQVRTYSVSGETTTYGATEVFTIADIPGGTVGGN